MEICEGSVAFRARPLASMINSASSMSTAIASIARLNVPASSKTSSTMASQTLNHRPKTSFWVSFKNLRERAFPAEITAREEVAGNVKQQELDVAEERDFEHHFSLDFARGKGGLNDVRFLVDEGVVHAVALREEINPVTRFQLGQ